MEPIEKGNWRTQDGRVIPIKLMGDEHLKNAIRYLQCRYALSNKTGSTPTKYIRDSYDYMIQTRKDRQKTEKAIKKSAKIKNKEINILEHL